ncbi:Asparagine--tRNA ligase, variant 2 [Balamuthia mandrillaris]
MSDHFKEEKNKEVEGSPSEEEEQPKTLEEALEEIKRLRAATKDLQSRLELEKPSGRHIFAGRLVIKEILGRKDKGEKLIGQVITVAGWVRTMRVQGKGAFAFVELNDGSTLQGLQLVVDKSRPGFDDLSKNGYTGSSICARGRLVQSKGKGQKVELLVYEVALVGTAHPDAYPLAKKEHSLEFLRTIAHLRPRTNFIGSVARVRNALAFAVHKFFQERGFLYVHTPLITASDCEGAGEMFQVTTLLSKAKKTSDIPTTNTGDIDYAADFFSKPAFLTVSGQLNAEHYACALSNVYTFGPTFRAEDSNTARHLAEFWMIEPEIAFGDIHDNMDLAEDFLKFVIQYVLDNCMDDLQYFEKQQKPGLVKRLEEVVSTPFRRITYTSAVEQLIKSGAKFEHPVEWGIDLSSEHERYITENIYKGPVIVTDYPKDIKAFYMRLNEDGKTVAAMDVLVPKVGELMGGSQREERLEKLLEKYVLHL